MAGRIPENILEDILSRVDIVEVISGCLPLKRSGRNFKANCPFHHEKTPSFMVSPDRQIYHCFGCGESGNAFKFLMRYEHLEFPEAVTTLAKKSGVVLPQVKRIDQETTSLSTQLYRINELAVDFYKNNLNSTQGNIAREYLLERKITSDTIKELGLGFAPDKWDALISYLRTKSINLSLLEKAGLILAKEGGGYYDRFRNRLILPIYDIKSRVVGFGARVLPGLSRSERDDSLPKYVNSPETPIYIKGKNLYGLNLAKDSIRESDFVVIVEGYLDFIIPYQEGITNIVASQGTALTVEQLRLLKRYTSNAIMVYDGDSAGELATLRSLDLFVEEEMEVRAVSLPKGFDPDSFVRKYGVSGLKEKIRQAKGLFDYKLGILRTSYNSKEAEGKAKISILMLETLNKFKNAILKSEYIKRLSQELNIREDALLEELKKFKSQRTYEDISRDTPKKALNINPTEQLLIKLMLEENELIQHIKAHLEPADFQDERISRIISVMFDLVEQGKSIKPASLMNHLGDEEVSQVICESVFLPQNQSLEDKEKVLDDCIKRLKSKKMRMKKENLHEQIKTAQALGDETRLQNLLEEFQYLLKGKS